MKSQSETREIEELFDSPCLRQFANEVAAGLSRDPKSLPCKYLYDEEGSRIFKEIMELEEYYPTRCETEIIARHKGDIARLIGENEFNLVELGAGDGVKTKILIRCFLETGLRFRYVPIDISDWAVQGLIGELKRDFRGLTVQGLVSDYFEGLRSLGELNRRTNLVLFLGSNIGNFTPSETRAFLSGLRASMNNGDFVLIGFDLKKDLSILLRAYDDSRGVTARFNMNILRRINKELGGDFDPGRFEYFTTYNPRSGAIESFLISRRQQTVNIRLCGQTFSFAEWEPIHTESSYKFVREDFARLVRENGFQPTASFCDSRGYFIDALWRVRK
jgi:dimethylhistidine N-methyltransferase